MGASPINAKLGAELLELHERGVRKEALAALVTERTGKSYAPESMRKWLGHQKKKSRQQQEQVAAIATLRGVPEGQAPLAVREPKTDGPALGLARAAVEELAELSAECRAFANAPKTSPAERARLIELAAEIATQRYQLATELAALEQRAPKTSKSDPSTVDGAPVSVEVVPMRRSG